MTTEQPVILVKNMEAVVNAMRVSDGNGGYLSVNYEPGRSIQILKSLNDFDNGISMKGLKYPLIAMLLPIRIKRGELFYGTVKIPRIVIGHISKSGEGTEDVLPKYDSDGVFRTILYPCYYEFLRCLCLPNMGFIGMEPERLVHEVMENPCQQPVGQNSNDFIDSIEILNLELILNQTKTC